MIRYYDHGLFRTECGAELSLTIAYCTYGTLNVHRDNTVWICHALTASADAAAWWPGVVGAGCAIDPADHFIVCANILGSCYGTTGPAAGADFPLITIRDMVAAHVLLRKHLGLEKIGLLVGGSMGGYQALEWSIAEPSVIQRLALLATAAAESAWGIAIHEAQRMAIETDLTWKSDTPDAGATGLKTARAIGMLSYRSYPCFCEQQTDPDNEKLDGFRAAGYQRYQGEKLAARFTARSYWTLTKAMDTHNIARGRGRSAAQVLESIGVPALVIGIRSDLLCPVEEQRFLAAHLQYATLVEIDSLYGHDGFLIEAGTIGNALREWRN